MIEMFITTLGVDPKTKAPFVVLQDSDEKRVMPILLGAGEPEVIGVAVLETMNDVPLANLLTNLLNELGYIVAEVTLRQDAGNRCSGLVSLAPRAVARQMGLPSLQIACAAYDAIALSARARIPIMVPEAMFVQGGLAALLSQANQHASRSN